MGHRHGGNPDISILRDDSRNLRAVAIFSVRGDVEPADEFAGSGIVASSGMMLRW